jgi:hypothetical protein
VDVTPPEFEILQGLWRSPNRAIAPALGAPVFAAGACSALYLRVLAGAQVFEGLFVKPKLVRLTAALALIFF